jgi:hypothetical protein
LASCWIGRLRNRQPDWLVYFNALSQLKQTEAPSIAVLEGLTAFQAKEMLGNRQR